MPRPPGHRSTRTLRRPRREDLGLVRSEFAALQRLTTPAKIQAFLNALPANHEVGGETILSVREVLRQRRAHCIEGAFVAACALWVHGEAPLVLHMACDASDYPHVVALFRRGGHWGALSKTNGAVLRFRDPVYRSLRELSLSYFHEYANRRGDKTLRSYSGAFDLRRLDPADWVTAAGACQCGARPARAAAALPAAVAGAGEAAHAPRRFRAACGEGGRASEAGDDVTALHAWRPQPVDEALRPRGRPKRRA